MACKMIAQSSTVGVTGRRSLPTRAIARSTGRPSLTLKSSPCRSARLVVRAQTETQENVDVDKVVKDLQEKWDGVENKTSVVVYGVGAVVVLWLGSSLVSAINSVPLLPKVMELVGLGYTSWFVYRYLLFKSSREELLRDVEELKKKITGAEQ